MPCADRLCAHISHRAARNCSKLNLNSGKVYMSRESNSGKDWKMKVRGFNCPLVTLEVEFLKFRALIYPAGSACGQRKHSSLNADNYYSHCYQKLYTHHAHSALEAPEPPLTGSPYTIPRPTVLMYTRPKTFMSPIMNSPLAGPPY
jgi:hypothetical protein